MKSLPVVEKILHGSLVFFTIPDRLKVVSTCIQMDDPAYRWSFRIRSATKFPLLVLWNRTPAITAVFGVLNDALKASTMYQ